VSQQPPRQPSDIVLVSFQPGLDTVGVRALHEHLLEQGLLSTLLFLPDFHRPGPQQIEAVARFVRNREAAIVGLSLMSKDLLGARALTRRLVRDGVEVVWGGVHPSIDPEGCLREVRRICVGEGEEALVELITHLQGGRDPGRIPNLWCRCPDGAIRRNALRPLRHDLDSLPMGLHIPRRSWVMRGGDEIAGVDSRTFRRHARYGGAIHSTISSRGCPHRCSYCCNNAQARLYPDWRARYRSVEAVLLELEANRRRHPWLRMVNFHDDCFMARPRPELEAFCEAYPGRVGLPFIVRSTPRDLDPSCLAMLRSAGLAWISLGLQSGSDRVNREVYNRRSTSADFLSAARLVHEAGLAAFYDVILDNPFESDEERLHTARVLAAAPKPYFPQIFSLNLYEGTDLLERARAEGLLPQDTPSGEDYHSYHPHPLNHLVRLACFLDSSTTERLIEAWRRSPDGAAFRTGLALARLWVMAVAEPRVSLACIRRAEGGSWLAALGALPLYMAEGGRRLEPTLVLFCSRWQNRPPPGGRPGS